MRRILSNCGRVFTRFFMVLTCCLSTVYIAYAAPDRRISISVSDMTIGHVLEKLNKEYSYNFVMETSDVDIDRKVSVNLSDVSIDEVLDAILEGSDVTFDISGNTVLISEKAKEEKPSATVTGVVSDSEGNPLPGAYVLEKGTSNGAITDVNGVYSIVMTTSQKRLQVSYLGFEDMEVNVGNRARVNIVLNPDNQLLEGVVVTIGSEVIAIILVACLDILVTFTIFHGRTEFVTLCIVRRHVIELYCLTIND